jgi:hypothetical protein
MGTDMQEARMKEVLIQKLSVALLSNSAVMIFAIHRVNMASVDSETTYQHSEKDACCFNCGEEYEDEQ